MLNSKTSTFRSYGSDWIASALRYKNLCSLENKINDAVNDIFSKDEEENHSPKTVTGSLSPLEGSSKNVIFDPLVRVMLIPHVNEYKEARLIPVLFHSQESMLPPKGLKERIEMYDDLLSLENPVCSKKDFLEKDKEVLDWVSIKLEEISEEKPELVNPAFACLGSFGLLIQDKREINQKEQFAYRLQMREALPAIVYLLKVNHLTEEQRLILENAKSILDQGKALRDKEIQFYQNQLKNALPKTIKKGMEKKIRSLEWISEELEKLAF